MHVDCATWVVTGQFLCYLVAMQYKWEMWGKSQRQEYYQGFVKFLKAADDMEATVRVHKFSSPAQPAKVYVLHTGPVSEKALEPASSLRTMDWSAHPQGIIWTSDSWLFGT